MAFRVRQEEPKDFHEVEDVMEEAFRGMEMSDHKEQAVVGKLRVSDAYVPELALVAEGEDGKIVGHALLSEVLIRSGDQALRSLSLAPVSVLPEFQKQGVGSALIEEGLKRARELDYGSVIVLGNPEYYARFGFVPAINLGVKSPFEVPDDSFMVLELRKGELDGVSGTVQYPAEFNLD